MFTLGISMPRFKSIIIHQNSSKIKLFLQQNAKFSIAGGSAPRPPCLRRLGALPPNPQNSPPLRIPGYAPTPPSQYYYVLKFVYLKSREQNFPDNQMENQGRQKYIFLLTYNLPQL